MKLEVLIIKSGCCLDFPQRSSALEENKLNCRCSRIKAELHQFQKFFLSCFLHEAEVRLSIETKAFPKFPANIIEKIKVFRLLMRSTARGRREIIKEIFIVIMRAWLFLRLESLFVKVFLFMAGAIVEICIKTRLHKLCAKERRQMKNLRWNNGESFENVKIMQ